ncbi:hypothetical protein H2248_002500 [Termitomyces sp. 'cryptogamus']|nr:hypothetical protein H2248_002500 [Termitomyces sp. 'cryptogamus']
MSVLQPESHENVPPLHTITSHDIAHPEPSLPEPGPILDLPSNTMLLPIPTRLTDPQSSLVLQEESVEVRRMSPGLANADFSIAPDRSFVETASGLVARELKKYWDQILGVGKDVRSPYAITAFVNQHGKPMFRVGHRELSAPAADAAKIEERIISSFITPNETSTYLRTKHRSRISMHPHLSSIFKNSSTSKSITAQISAPRKLRKTRSISDMVSTANDEVPAQASLTTGRLHSRSVTGADVSPFLTVVRSPITVDLFGQLMDWHPPPTASASISTNSLISDEQSPNDFHESLKSPVIIPYPFGHGVSYDSPSRKSNYTEDADLLPVPRHLREVQSFESGLTARQVDDPPINRSGRESSLVMEIYLDDPDSKRPPSALRVYTPPSPLEPNDTTPTSITPESTLPTTPEPVPGSKPEPKSVESVIEPALEPVLLSRYSTEVFDVLQNYRGLPRLDKLSCESESTAVIKLSLSADESAAPRDDPRFVIWGEIQSDRDFDDQSLEYGSVTDLSSVRSSSLSRRRASKVKAVEPSSSRTSAGETQKVLIAATIERWIAQLTSDLNYDELLDFFLTYRTYIGSIDLLHLLIARFHWALQQSTSLKDERVHQIVRVRTFVAIRYWLLTFFTVDFIPNRELRLLMANWLNSLVRDPILRKHVNGLGIVRKLIKVAKECKQAHTHLPARSSSKPRKSISSKPVENHVLGARFAAATRKLSEDDDSDVDLDFLPDEGVAPIDTPQGFSNDIVNAHLGVNAHVGVGMSPTRPTSIPISSLHILQRTDHAPGPGSNADLPVIPQAQALPSHRSAVSRVITKTIGRLGRWRRTLNAWNLPNPPARTVVAPCADVSAFDLELNEPPELIVPLKTVDVPVPLSPEPPRVPTPPAIAKLAARNVDMSEQVVTESVVLEPEPGIQRSTEQFPNHAEPELPPGLSVMSAVTDIMESQSMVPSSVDQVSVRSSTSTDSFGEPLRGPPTFPQLDRPQWQFDVISIDDLSDTSSDFHEVEAGPSAGSRRPPKKLPMRRDFEFVRRDTVSSMGLTSRDSVASAPSSHASTASAIGLGGSVHQWQINALLDSLSDDEEKGDVEDALRRLEGQINPQKELEKASKVDGWVRTIRERLAAGDYSDEQPSFSDDSNEEEYGESYNDDGLDQDSASLRHETVSVVDLSSGQEEVQEVVKTPISTQSSHVITSPPGSTSPARSTDAKPAVEAVVPFEIIQGRLPSRPSTSSSANADSSVSSVSPRETTKPRSFVLMLPTADFSPRESPKTRSFVLMYRAADLAEHFAMIDRELFIGVKFEELVLDDWMNCQEVDVLDWAQYLKDRARWKVEHRYPDKTSALGAVRARFNLMANFTISEVVLASPSERSMVVAKLIRIAWKSYRLCNFSTLVAIITGLGSDWVAKAMKRTGWSRLGMWETRMYMDLKAFATNADDFIHIRQVVASIVDAKPLDVNPKTTSVISGGDLQPGKGKGSAERPAVPTACIPFIGVYLSQLQRHSRLPDLIDPTAPEESVGVNPDTSNFDAPAHPEVFAALTPLPSSMHLEPLINVHKQRRIASVIKALVAGQHLASRVQFDIDKKLFQKCLKVHAVNAENLQRTLLSE